MSSVAIVAVVAVLLAFWSQHPITVSPAPPEEVILYIDPPPKEIPLTQRFFTENNGTSLTELTLECSGACYDVMTRGLDLFFPPLPERNPLR